MRIRIAVPDGHVTPGVLNAALEATTRANEQMLASGDAPPISEAIKRGAVKWKPEPFKDGEHFDLSKTVHERGWGDCDDLAPALAAELRHKGVDEGARAVVKKSGPKRWHAITELSDGRTVDPSEMAGMYEYKKRHGDSFVNGPGRYGVHGAVIGLLSRGHAMIGVKPYKGKWASRCDLPVEGAPCALVGVAMHDDALEAITGAVNAACVVGAASGMITPEDIARALCVRSCFAGAHPEAVAHALEQHISGDEVGSLFGSIFHGLKSVASPLAHLATKAGAFLPIPGASLAAQAAESMLNHHGGSGGHAAPVLPHGLEAPGLAAMVREPAAVHAPQGPHGPIIVKF